MTCKANGLLRLDFIHLTRNGAVAARLAHTPKDAGASPASATNFKVQSLMRCIYAWDAIKINIISVCWYVIAS